MHTEKHLCVSKVKKYTTIENSNRHFFHHQGVIFVADKRGSPPGSNKMLTTIALIWTSSLLAVSDKKKLTHVSAGLG